MTETKCPNCGNEVAPEAQSCPGCNLQFSPEDKKTLWSNKGDLLSKMGRFREASAAY